MDQNLWDTRGHFIVGVDLSPAIKKFTLHKKKIHSHCGNIYLVLFVQQHFSFCAKSVHSGSFPFSRLFKCVELPETERIDRSICSFFQNDILYLQIH